MSEMIDYRDNKLFKPLPSLNTPVEFSSIKSLLEEPICRFNPPSTIEDILSSSIELIFHLGAHWLVQKKWSTKHKIPAPKQISNVAEPLGKLLFHLLELCAQCHLAASAANINLRHKNAWNWFVTIFWEIKGASLSKIETEEIGKAESIQTHRQKIIKPLEKGVNPISSIAQPNLKSLLDVAQSLAKSSNTFDRDYWKPFLKEYKKWVTHCDREKNIIRINLDANGIYYHSGRGRYSKYVLK
ncbi:MAG: hypothetical protein ACYTXI_38320 [Nostoc sp.]